MTGTLNYILVVLVLITFVVGSNIIIFPKILAKSTTTPPLTEYTLAIQNNSTRCCGEDSKIALQMQAESTKLNAEISELFKFGPTFLINDDLDTIIDRLGGNPYYTGGPTPLGLIVNSMVSDFTSRENLALKILLIQLMIDSVKMNPLLIHNPENILFMIGGGSRIDDPDSQALILLSIQLLKDYPKIGNQTLTQITRQIAESKDPHQTLLNIATRIASGGSNDTNNEINKISNVVTLKHFLLFDPTNVLYQIGLQIANKGGNMSRAMHKIDSSISFSGPGVSRVPIVAALLHLVAFERDYGNLNILDQAIYNMTSVVVRGNENNIDKIIIKFVNSLPRCDKCPM